MWMLAEPGLCLAAVWIWSNLQESNMDEACDGRQNLAAKNSTQQQQFERITVP